MAVRRSGLVRVADFIDSDPVAASWTATPAWGLETHGQFAANVYDCGTRRDSERGIRICHRQRGALAVRIRNDDVDSPEPVRGRSNGANRAGDAPDCRGDAIHGYCQATLETVAIDPDEVATDGRSSARSH